MSGKGKPWLKYQTEFVNSEAREPIEGEIAIETPYNDQLPVVDTSEKSIMREIYENTPHPIDAARQVVGAGVDAVKNTWQDFIKAPQVRELTKYGLQNNLMLPGGSTAFGKMSEGEKADAIRNQKQAENTSSAKALAIGANREISNLARGAENIFDSTPIFSKYWNGPEQVKKRNEQWNRDAKVYKALSDVHPVATTVGEMAPYMLIPPGRITETGVGLIPKGVRDKFMKGVVNTSRKTFDVASKMQDGALKRFLTNTSYNLPQLPGKIKNSPLVDALATGYVVGGLNPDMSANEGAAYGLMGYGAGKGGYKLFSRAKNSLNQTEQEIVDRALQRGYPVDPGIRTGNKYLQELDQGFRKNTRLGRTYKNVDAEIQRLDNQAISAAIGNPTDELTSGWYAQTKQALNEGYDFLRTQIKPKVTGANRSKIINSTNEYERVYGKLPKVLETTRNDMWRNLRVNGGEVTMDAKQLMDFRRQISERIKDAYGGRKPEVAQVLKKYQEVIDDAIKDGATPQALNMLKDYDRKWALLGMLNKANVMENGKVNMEHLGMRIKDKYGNSFHKGNTGIPELDDLYHSIRFADMRANARAPSLGMSDRISKAWSNPGYSAAGKIGQMGDHIYGASDIMDSLLLGSYRKGWLPPNPAILPSKMKIPMKNQIIDLQDLAGTVGSRKALSGE